MKILRILALISIMLMTLQTPLHAAQIQYRDWATGTLAMIIQAIIYDEARLFYLGPASDGGAFQAAMLISENPEKEDSGEKNAVLLECGMHGREWYAAETCYWFIDYLLQNRHRSDVHDLLSHVDIWVIPQSNPAGRNIDDLMFGDPTQFAYVCNDGDRKGKPCDSDGDCPGGNCYTTGWRSNADLAACELGVDIARNFSSGWNDASQTCDVHWCRGGTNNGKACSRDADCGSGSCVNKPMQYRGPHPFSELETLNLRRFVNNHMISTVGIFHANAQQIFNIWANESTALDYMTDELVSLNDTGSGTTYADAKMTRQGVGNGYGQFSGWLTSPSDVAGELDEGTERNISTFYFELPIRGNKYNIPYRNATGDNSNSFHPSGDTMEQLWNAAILDLMRYVTRQGRSPYCPVDDAGNRLVSQCPARDFGIVGAKIADAIDQPGLLDYNTSTREEILPAGEHEIVVAVQNFSSSANSSSASITWTITDGATTSSNTTAISLSLGDRTVQAFNYTFERGKEYKITIELSPDDFNRNDRKVFAFKVPDPYELPDTTLLGRAWIRIGDDANDLRYVGQFITNHDTDPASSGMYIVIHGYTPYISDQTPSIQQLSYKLPGGSPWWDKSRPKIGIWIYDDPNGEAGPVSRLIIINQQLGTKNGKNHNMAVYFHIKGEDLKHMANARSFSVKMGIGNAKLILRSLAKGTQTDLPPKKLPPGDETEDEPGLEQGQSDLM